jgi:hypothetical protein
LATFNVIQEKFDMAAPAKSETIQFGTEIPRITKKSGIGLQHGTVSELATFFEVKPGHEEALRAACERLANTLRNAPLDLNIRTGLRDERHVIFDGGKRLLWVTTFETDWDPYVEDAIVSIGVENFIDWIQHLKEWDRFEAWILESGGVEVLNKSMSDAGTKKAVRASTRGLKEFLQSRQVQAAGYFNALSYTTHPEIQKALKVNQAFQRVLDDPAAAELLKHPAFKPLLEQASD